MAGNTRLNHQGRCQAQGLDISQKGGYSTKWEEALPPTKDHGGEFLEKLTSQCEAMERKLRAEAFSQAHKYVRRAPPNGISAPVSKCFYAQSPPKRAKNARVDLEVHVGRAFVDASAEKDGEE